MKSGRFAWGYPKRPSILHGGAIYEPHDVASAQFSLPFSLALRLVKDDNSLSNYMDASLWRDPTVLDIAHKVKSHAEPEAKGQLNYLLSSGTHAVRVKGKVRFSAGRVISVDDAGAGLVETLFLAAERVGIAIAYGTKVIELLADTRGGVSGVTVRTSEGQQDVEAKGVVLASGGFEANPEMRVKSLGPGWDLVKVRGCRYNTGETLEMGLRAGAQATGHWSGCHAVMVDAEAPPYLRRLI
jgi:hypothetical protein